MLEYIGVLTGTYDSFCGSIINCWFHTILPWTWRIHSNVTGVSSFVAPSAPPPQMRVAGLPQCGMFMDQPNYKGQPLYSPRYASIFKLMGALVSLLDIPTSHGDVCKSETNWIYFPYVWAWPPSNCGKLRFKGIPYPGGHSYWEGFTPQNIVNIVYETVSRIQGMANSPSLHKGCIETYPSEAWKNSDPLKAGGGRWWCC